MECAMCLFQPIRMNKSENFQMADNERGCVVGVCCAHSTHFLSFSSENTECTFCSYFILIGPFLVYVIKVWKNGQCKNLWG